VIRMLRRFAPVFALVAVFALASTAGAADAKGKIKTVNADKNEFVVQDADGKSWTFMATKDCKCTLNDKEGKLADLQADDEVQITYDKDGDRLNCTAIRATRK
jgi:hypothetical protein